MSQYVKDLLNIWYVPNQFKTQEMWNRAVQRVTEVLEYFLISLRPKRCGIEQYKEILGP